MTEADFVNTFAKTRNFFMQIQPVSSKKQRFSIAGMSLVEILMVAAVVASLASMLAPAMSGFSNTTSRRGAINVVMNTIDHARVAALEKGLPVHILFSRHPDATPDALIVLREDDDGNIERLTQWIPLPKGVLFQDKMGVFSQSIDTSLLTKIETTLAKKLPTESGANAVLSFGASGNIIFPSASDSTTAKNARQIRLIAGIRENNIESLRSEGADVISITHFTGRPQLDVSFE